MRNFKVAHLVIPALLVVTPLRAQDISGIWQGAIHPAPGEDLRAVLKVSKSKNNSWAAQFYTIDQSPHPITVSSISLRGQAFKLTIAPLHLTYEGTWDPAKGTIAGTMTQDQTLPLDFVRATKETAWAIDPSPHKASFITVQKGIKLEVLDWGGMGRPLVFLAGLGADAHVFDKLALKFASTNHVYGITRRGYGASSKPEPAKADYSSDRLGDDVLAVMDALKLDRPVLVGHSLAGEELSSVGSRYPDKVAGLVYLDAGYSYAYYAPGNVIPLGWNLRLAADALQRDFAQLKTASLAPHDLDPTMKALQTDLPNFETDYAATKAAMKLLPAPSPQPQAAQTKDDRIVAAIVNGSHKYTKIDVPILALFEDPPFLPADTPPGSRAAQDDQFDLQAKTFEAGLPSAHVVRIANARHSLWLSNEADVLREMNGFIGKLN